MIAAEDPFSVRLISTTIVERGVESDGYIYNFIHLLLFIRSKTLMRSF